MLEGLNGLGNRLKELRAQRDLTMDMVVYAVATEYHIEFNKSNLSRWENGTSYPSLVNAAALAKYYGVSLDYLIGNTDIKTPIDLMHKPHIRRKAYLKQLQDDEVTRIAVPVVYKTRVKKRGATHGKRTTSPKRSLPDKSNKGN